MTAALNTAPKGLDYPFDKPAFGEPVEIASGIYWLRLPLPFALDHVNVWLLKEPDGWTIIDTGVNNEACLVIWESVFGGLLKNEPVQRVIATHYHPDHIGLAGKITADHDASLWASHTEWLTARMLCLDTGSGFVEATESYDKACGLDEEMIQKRKARGNLYRKAVVLPPSRFRQLRADDRINIAGRSFRVLVGRGHAPEMVTLFSEEEGILIAADQILPRISPVIGVWPMLPHANPLDDYFQSMGQYKGLPEDVLVLPSHGSPFRGLHRRIESLISHHEERLDLCREYCRTPQVASALLRVLFNRKIDLQQVGFALGEALAHLNYLVDKGELVRTTNSHSQWLFETL